MNSYMNELRDVDGVKGERRGEREREREGRRRRGYGERRGR